MFHVTVDLDIRRFRRAAGAKQGNPHDSDARGRCRRGIQWRIRLRREWVLFGGGGCRHQRSQEGENREKLHCVVKLFEA